MDILNLANKLLSALTILLQIFLFFGRRQTLTAEMLPELCPGHPHSLLSSTVDQLLAAGIIHTHDKNERLFPTMPAADLDQGTIVKAILGTDTPDTAGGQLSRRALDAASQAASQALPLSPQEDQNS